jgi:hypothetical protein
LEPVTLDDLNDWDIDRLERTVRTLVEEGRVDAFRARDTAHGETREAYVRRLLPDLGVLQRELTGADMLRIMQGAPRVL